MIAVAALVLTVVGINAFAPRRLPPDPLEAALRLQWVGMDGAALEILESAAIDLESNDTASLDLAYTYISSYFHLYGASGDTGDVKSVYHSLSDKPGAVADVGLYGQGLISSIEGRYDKALEYFERVSDRDQRYLNNSIGHVYLELGDYGQAEVHLRREIVLDGNMLGAVGNLTRLYLETGRFNDARGLIEDPETGPYVAYPDRAELARRTGRIGRYVFIVLLSPWRHVEISATLAALVICASWFVYLWRIDVFKQEPLRYTLGALALGALTSVLILLLYDLASLVSPFAPGDDKGSELLYYLLHVGLLEESLKFAPVVAIVLLFRQVDEPLDIVIYGSLTALGFATVENLLYFSGYGLGIGYGRFVISTVVHLSLTGSVCYAWARARYITKRNPILPVLVRLLIAGAIHGLFDFSLINLTYSPFLWFVYMGLVLVLSVSYARMLRRTLYHSSFRDVYSAHSGRLNNRSLLYCMALFLLLIGYLQDHALVSTSVANFLLFITFVDPLFPYLVVLTMFGVLGKLEAREPIKLSTITRRLSDDWFSSAQRRR
jgi:RsiW-degrading membrane proteinase PrsW (M82 family)